MLWRSEAEQIFYTATGTREQIQPAIDRFKHDITYGIGGDKSSPPLILGSYKVATLDDVDSASIGNYRGMVSSGGMELLAVPGDSLYVSDGLAEFSPPNGLTLQTAGAAGIGLAMFHEPVLPSGDLPPNSAIGAVFANITTRTQAQLGYIGLPAPNFVPVTSGPGVFTFVGVLDLSSTFQFGVISLGGLLELPPDARPTVDDLLLGNVAILPEPRSATLLLLTALLTWILFQGRQHRHERDGARERIDHKDPAAGSAPVGIRVIREICGRSLVPDGSRLG
jgi:hypothetical protein